MRRDLNFVVQKQDLSLSGREFQMQGAAKEKDLSPQECRDLGSLRRSMELFKTLKTLTAYRHHHPKGIKLYIQKNKLMKFSSSTNVTDDPKLKKQTLESSFPFTSRKIKSFLNHAHN